MGATSLNEPLASRGGSQPITQKELANRLRELAAANKVQREAFAEVPPRVEYRITDVGRSIMPVLFALADWDKQHGLNLGVRDGKASKGAAED